MTLHDGIAPGYRCVGLSSDGLWGKWVAADVDCDRAEWEAKREQQRAVQARKRAESLTALDRDHLYRRLFEQLALHAEDRVDLTRRGLTDEQIELGGFKSVEPRQKLQIALNPALPGVSADGDSLNNSQAGYLCPVRNVRGLVVGCQIRMRSTSEGGRYRWLTNEIGPHLPIGELPLAVHRSIEPSSVVGLVEGVGVKPFVASQRVGHTFIGAAGGLFAASPQTLLKTLEVLQPTEVLFYPDAGAITNHLVLQQYQSSWALVEEFGLKIQIAWWGQITKVSPDIDELDDLDRLQFIAPSAFWMKCKAIAMADYQALFKALGITPTAEQKSQVHRLEAIELLKSNFKLRQSQEVFYYRESVRALMFQLELDWSHPSILAWLETRKVDVSQLRINDLKDLKTRLERVAESLGMHPQTQTIGGQL